MGIIARAIILRHDIQPGSSEFSMLVVSDVDDVFLPKPQDILVGLTEARAGLEVLLGRFNDMFQGTHQAASALGPAMQAAYKLIVRLPTL